MKTKLDRNWAIGITASALLATPMASLAVATALVTEGDELPGAPGSFVTGIGNPAANQIGGYAVSLTTDGTTSHIWGNANGGPGTVIQTEAVIGNFAQQSFESFNGFSNAGQPAYSASSNRIAPAQSGIDGVWLGNTPILNEEEGIPGNPGQFSSFNSRPGVTADGQPYWVGGLTDMVGGATQIRGLFFGAGANILLRGGDSVTGVTENIDNESATIDFDFRFSALGTNYITPVLLNDPGTTDQLVVVNGAALTAGGGSVREGSPVPMAIGGLGGELWDSFDFMGITEAGITLVTGNTSAPGNSNEFVMVNGQIVLREGEVINTSGGPGTVTGTIDGAYLNENGDWAAIWNVSIGPTTFAALIVNGEAVLLEGDAVDLDGDGIAEPANVLASFTGMSSLVLGPRDALGNPTTYFTADVNANGLINESAFRLSDTPIMQANPVPTTSLTSLLFTTLMLLGLGAFYRRKT